MPDHTRIYKEKAKIYDQLVSECGLHSAKNQALARVEYS